MTPTRQQPFSEPVEWPAWPTYGLIDDLLPTLTRWQHHYDTIALATLVDIVGSSPRPLGAEMAIAPDGRVAGYVSGGCVEGAVAAEAAEVIRDGAPRLLDYGAGSPVLDVQLTCGGRIGILVRRLDDLAGYVRMRADARARRACLTLDIDRASGQAHPVPDPASAAPAAGVFRQIYAPPVRVVLVGGDPVTLAVAEAAGQLGMEAALLRPYGPSAAPPGLHLAFYDTRPLRTVLADLVLDDHCALYSLTHDIDDDEAVLQCGLASPAFRCGVLGSRRKADERRRRLADAGATPQELARIDMPAGLDIGAVNPREIAASIIAAVVAARPRTHPR